MLHDLPDDDAFTAAPFRVADALARGLDPGSLRSERFDTPTHGVRAPQGSTSSLLARCRAVLPVLDDGVVFSHVTALRILGVDVPWTLRDQATDDARLHVVTRVEADRPQRGDLVSHRSRQDFIDTTIVGGLPITTPAQTFVQVATDLRLPDDIVVLGDAMMRHRREMTTPAELSRIAAQTRKVKGIVPVREQISRTRPGTDSVMETRTRLRITDANLPCPLVNATIRLDDGTYVKRCDLLYPEHRIVIEYDGDQHRTDRRQWQDDIRRRRWLEELGFAVIVVVGDDFGRASSTSKGDIVDRIRPLLLRPTPLMPGAERVVVVPYSPGDPTLP